MNIMSTTRTALGLLLTAALVLGCNDRDEASPANEDTAGNVEGQKDAPSHDAQGSKEGSGRVAATSAVDAPNAVAPSEDGRAANDPAPEPAAVGGAVELEEADRGVRGEGKGKRNRQDNDDDKWGYQAPAKKPGRLAALPRTPTAGKTAGQKKDHAKGENRVKEDDGRDKNGQGLFDTTIERPNQPDEVTVGNMFFQHYGVNPTVDTVEEPRSTFSVDVDQASYTMVRSFLDRNSLPNEAAVRVEELVNAFDYQYEAPTDETFRIHAEAAPSPNRRGYHLLHVGIKGKDIAKSARKTANLVFVVDVSGSMSGDNRLGLVKRSLNLLVGQLAESDSVAIVVYGSSARTVLPATSAHFKPKILQAINALKTEGATNAEAGLRMGYGLADKNFKQGGINRVILCSDGVANSGMTGTSGLLDMIRSKAKKGVTISTVGFGMGNYNDVMMEKLANGGDGNYHYVDKLAEAKRVFVDELTGTLQVIARDVKIQVNFDPTQVVRYRLVGYENRKLKARDFDNDKVDAGEVGAGHSVTAIYEVKLAAGANKDLAKVRVRFKSPSGGASKLVEQGLHRGVIRADEKQLSSPTQLSLVAAQFAEKLRGSYWARNLSYDDILERFDRIKSPLRQRTDVVELRKLVQKARDIDKRGDKFEKHGPVAQMDFDRVPILR